MKRWKDDVEAQRKEGDRLRGALDAAEKDLISIKAPATSEASVPQSPKSTAQKLYPNHPSAQHPSVASVVAPIPMAEAELSQFDDLRQDLDDVLYALSKNSVPSKAEFIFEDGSKNFSVVYEDLKELKAAGLVSSAIHAGAEMWELTELGRKYIVKLIRAKVQTD